MEDSKEPVKLINKALELIHPHLFKSSLAAREELCRNPLTRKVALKWESVFTAITAISNRTSKPHRDSGGEPGWYDFLLSQGSYSYSAIELDEIGARFAYTPGTAVAFCANIFKHGVSEWGRGDRICYVFFNKKVVMERLGQHYAGWMTKPIFEGGGRLLT